MSADYLKEELSTGLEPVQYSTSLLSRLRRDWAAMTGLVIIITLVLLAVLAPVIAPYDPIKTEPVARLQGSSFEHWLGTDQLGRDTLSRLLWGSRLSLGTTIIAALLTMIIGVSIGTVAGYYGGWVDNLLMRIGDVLLAFPGLILALAIVGLLGPSVQNVVLALVSVWWVSYARVTRGLVLSLRERDYIEAARAMGNGNGRIILRHILPNVIPPVIVFVTLEMGRLLLTISGLSFLGLGAQPPTPEWGAMLNAGRTLLQKAPELMIYPGIAISLAVLGFNLLGDGLRDALDPRLRHVIGRR